MTYPIILPQRSDLVNQKGLLDKLFSVLLVAPTHTLWMKLMFIRTFIRKY